MENVTVFSLSDKCEINTSQLVLSNVSLTSLAVETILHVMLFNILEIQWSMEHTLGNDIL